MVAAVLDAPMSAAPDGDDSAKQVCEHAQASAAVDDFAVAGTMHVATAVPPAADAVGDDIAPYQHFSVAIPQQSQQHAAIVRLLVGSTTSVPRCGRRGRGGIGR